MPINRKIYSCPAGHPIAATVLEPVECDACELVATHYNASTGEVYQWTNRDIHRAACERLQDEMDAAFDNQYFNEGGW